MARAIIGSINFSFLKIFILYNMEFYCFDRLTRKKLILLMTSINSELKIIWRKIEFGAKRV